MLRVLAMNELSVCSVHASEDALLLSGNHMTFMKCQGCQSSLSELLLAAPFCDRRPFCDLKELFAKFN